MKAAILALILLLSACGDGGCDCQEWPPVIEKPTHAPQEAE